MSPLDTDSIVAIAVGIPVLSALAVIIYVLQRRTRRLIKRKESGVSYLDTAAGPIPQTKSPKLTVEAPSAPPKHSAEPPGSGNWLPTSPIKLLESTRPSFSSKKRNSVTPMYIKPQYDITPLAHRKSARRPRLLMDSSSAPTKYPVSSGQMLPPKSSLLSLGPTLPALDDTTSNRALHESIAREAVDTVSPHPSKHRQSVQFAEDVTIQMLEPTIFKYIEMAVTRKPSLKTPTEMNLSRKSSLKKPKQQTVHAAVMSPGLSPQEFAQIEANDNGNAEPLHGTMPFSIKGEILSARICIRGLRVVTLGPSANDVDYLAISDAYERFLLPMNSDQYGFNTDTMEPNPVNGVHVVKLVGKLRRTELFRGFGPYLTIVLLETKQHHGICIVEMIPLT
ncbi:hypothetical protein SeLEV6574_g01644 [Synchytrium endobioticum]|uniref:Uncharacterized protein n=1 Tax=Synchytrium endobioticum TaxID=286115 RepID=A0A507DCB1_9FUNG|nr:hypothetical protein SeLEV6574_g01644 [Synchytrium endobioticum]